MHGLKWVALLPACGVLAAIWVLSPTAQILFAAHMTQHLLIIVVAAPLLAASGLRIPIASAAGWSVFIVTFLFWHWPAAFGWAATHHYGTLLELISILIAALSFWSGILGPGHAADGARVLLVMTAAVLTDLPGVVMLFAPRVICTMPHESSMRFNLTALEDQQVSGLLMWVPANLVFFAIAIGLFARWMRESHPSTVTA